MTLKLAVKNSVVLKLKYFPNKDGKARSGWRTVLPLDLYSYRNVNYMLGWQSDGSSVSGGSGYRLFFTRNIQEYKEADTSVQQPFAMIKIQAAQHKIELKVKAWYMVKLGQNRMSLTVTQRPDQSGVWVAAKNPVIYKMTRRDYNWTTLVDDGLGNTRIQIATNVTASFVAGDIIWLQSDDAAYSANGLVISSVFGADTTVVTDIPYVANNASGYINTVSRRFNYYIGVGVFKSSDNSLIGTVNYSPTTRWLATIDVSSVILSALDATLPSGVISEGFINDSTAYQGFYIKYTEFWTGSGNSATDDVANPSYGVIAANQIGQNSYLTENFLTKQDRFKITGSDWYSVSLLDTLARANIFLSKRWYIGNQLLVNTFNQSVVTPGKQIYSYFQKLLSTSLNYINENLNFILNASSGTSWTIVTNGLTVTLATGTNSKAGLAPCFIPTGSTVSIDWGVGNSGNNCNIDITFRDNFGISISTTSILSTSSTLTTGVTTITAPSDIYCIGFVASNSSGSNRDFTVFSARVLIPISSNRVDLTGTNIASSLPINPVNFTSTVISDIVCSNNTITIFWRNSQGGESSWSFGYTQDQVQKLQDPQKNNWLTLYEQNLTLAQFNALNELFSVNQVYQTPIIELTTSVDKTAARVGQQVYTVDSSGNKIGVIVIGGENKTRTRNKRHSFQVTIELPEIFG